jgi:hypothetical protein
MRVPMSVRPSLTLVTGRAGSRCLNRRGAGNGPEGARVIHRSRLYISTPWTSRAVAQSIDRTFGSTIEPVHDSLEDWAAPKDPREARTDVERNSAAWSGLHPYREPASRQCTV